MENQLSVLPLMTNDDQPIPSNDPPKECLDCGEEFPKRNVNGKWAELCLDCKRKRYHKLEGFPGRYQGIHLSDCREREGNSKALEAARIWVEYEGHRNLLFYGSPGTGKTYIGSAAANDGPIGNVRFVSVPEMLLEFQAGVKEREELPLISKYQGKAKSGSSFYVSQIFDDIGAHRVSDFALEMFGILLERFYSNNTMGLIFTSNLSPREIVDRMGERISSRLCGLANPIKIEGTDLRHEKIGRS
jgi:DNA replication protein DnaC